MIKIKRLNIIMVVINETITFNMKLLRNNLSTCVKDFISQSLNYYLEKNIIEKISKNSGDYIKEKLMEDYFVNICMDRKICSHKFRKGKNEGKFCCKKINTNLPENAKEDFMCIKHSKKHIPRKKNNSKNLLKVPEDSQKIDIKLIKNNIHGNLHEINKLNNKKIIKRKNRKNKFLKIIIGNPCTLNFSSIFKNLLT